MRRRIAYVETSCREPAASVAPDPSPYAIDDPGYRRAEGDSYLTYPEWYIVHAYTDLAGVTRQSSESAFDYSASIAGFWHSLCRSTRAASRVGPVTADQKTTNYIIGLSFTAEMAIIGAWEHTIGAVTAWLRGRRRTAEDEFALAFANDYAAFLQQTPWYRYPFAPQLLRFWCETPLGQGNLARSLERRLALSLEYGGKAIYAVAIGALAGFSPADLRIRSVVTALSADDLAAEPRIVKIRDLPGGAMLIETPRYQEYTEILRTLGARGKNVFEIAGNRRILATVLARTDAALATPRGDRVVRHSNPIAPGMASVGSRRRGQEIDGVDRRGGEAGRRI